MFSSSKILFSNYTAASVPLRITSQPQNVTLSSGSRSTIGQTVWATSSGFKRSAVQWERSLDGQNWFPESGYNSNEQDGGFRINGGANPAQSGLKYRAYAYAYERYTVLPNYMDLSNPYENLEPTTGQAGRLFIGGEYPGDYAFIFLKGGQFSLDLYFSGEAAATGTDSSFVSVYARVGGRALTEIRNIPARWESGIFRPAENNVTVDFSASPGELIGFDLSPNQPPLVYDYRYYFIIRTKNADVPYVGPKVVSEPFTLTVTP